MIGVVIVTHAQIAAELCRAAEMILGPLEAVKAVSIEAETSVDAARNEIFEAVRTVGHGGAGVLILTDLFGGTPTNIGAELLETGEVELLTGVNLPMLLKCVGARSGCGLKDLTAMLKEYTQTSIIRPAELLC